MTYALGISRSIYAEASTSKPYEIVGDSEIYRKDSEGNEVYAYGYDDKPIFAKRLTCKADEICIYYAKDKDGNEVYPAGNDGREKIIYKGKYGQLFPVYAVDKKGVPFYPRNDRGIEYIPINAELIKLSNGELKQPARNTISDSFETAMEIEAAMDANDQEKGNKTHLFGIARNLQTGNPIYADTAENEVVFPTDTYGNEYYLKDLSGNDYIFNSFDEEIDRYARKNDDCEFYPKQISKSKGQLPSDFIIEKTYARTSNDVVLYPLDSFNNEFTIVASGADVFDRCFPIGYPITNDEFYIVPETQGKYPVKLPYLKIDESSHSHRLYRGDMGHRDILTSVKCTERKSRAPAKIAYGGMELKSKSAPPATKAPAVQPPQPALPSSKGSLFGKMIYIFVTVAILAIGCLMAFRNKQVLPMRYESSSPPASVFV